MNGVKSRSAWSRVLAQCIDVLTFGLQEVMASPTPGTAYRTLISRQAVIDLIRRMSSMIGREEPHWGGYRRPGVAMIRRCIDCGIELTATEKERCPICETAYAYTCFTSPVRLTFQVVMALQW
jgi:hypothetical protein